MIAMLLPEMYLCAVGFPPGGLLLWLGLSAAIAVLLLALRIYWQLLQRARAGHGNIAASPFGLPDLLVSSVLFAWLGGAAIQGFAHPASPRTLTERSIIESGLLFGAVVGVILLVLHARQHSATRTFGLKPASLRAVAAAAARYFVTALPLVFFCFALVNLLVGEEAQPQEIAQFFTEAAADSNWPRMLLAGSLAVLVAPVTEEFIFRGYLYGVLRRYLGVTPALILTSLLFASIHLNGAVFLPLFVLAACLTLAYEATGSLLASIFMHALFNATMLGMMFYSARNP